MTHEKFQQLTQQKDALETALQWPRHCMSRKENADGIRAALCTGKFLEVKIELRELSGRMWHIQEIPQWRADDPQLRFCEVIDKALAEYVEALEKEFGRL